MDLELTLEKPTSETINSIYTPSQQVITAHPTHYCLTQLLCNSADYLKNTMDIVSAEQDQYWIDYKESICVHLKAYIQAKENSDKHQIISLNRHLVRLHFIHLLLSTESDTSEISPSLLMEYRQSLVYMLNETMRYLGNKEVKFLTRPLKFTKCLLLLIRYHAEYFIHIHLPTSLTNIIKKAIVTNELSERQCKIENIQHSTDVYMMGFILLNIDLVELNDSRKTVIEYISSLSTIESKARESFSKGFALAAIFHDISILPACNNVCEKQALEYLKKHVVPKENERKFSNNWNNPKKIHFNLSIFNSQTHFKKE